jgi:hypothetical protein
MRYIIGFLVTIGLIIVALILMFHGGSNSGQTPQTTAPALSQYANTDTQVRLTIDGPINSPTDHRQVRITVGQAQAEADVLQGYQGQVLKQQTTGNDSTSYAAFLHSLQLAGFAKGSTNAKLRDERGYCPQGNRFIYEIIRSDHKDQERYWYTSCGQGSFQGAAQLTNDLFRAQVSNYETLVGNIFL